MNGLASTLPWHRRTVAPWHRGTVAPWHRGFWPAATTARAEVRVVRQPGFYSAQRRCSAVALAVELPAMNHQPASAVGTPTLQPASAVRFKRVSLRQRSLSARVEAVMV